MTTRATCFRIHHYRPGAVDAWIWPCLFERARDNEWWPEDDYPTMSPMGVRRMVPPFENVMEGVRIVGTDMGLREGDVVSIDDGSGWVRNAVVQSRVSDHAMAASMRGMRIARLPDDGPTIREVSEHLRDGLIMTPEMSNELARQVLAQTRVARVEPMVVPVRNRERNFRELRDFFGRTAGVIQYDPRPDEPGRGRDFRFYITNAVSEVSEEMVAATERRFRFIDHAMEDRAEMYAVDDT